MDKLTIGYEFDLSFIVRKPNGKIYKNHHVEALGISFGTALYEAYAKLKKRRCEIIGITGAQARRIAFAFDSEGKSVKVALADHPAAIPEDLSGQLNYLPKNN